MFRSAHFHKIELLFSQEMYDIVKYNRDIF